MHQHAWLLQFSHLLAIKSLKTGGSEEETPAVIFKAKASDITTNGAVLTITHDGTKDDTFYGFCYDDTAT
ncbi:MAG: hypothetical protein K2G80_03495, partial [Bacteroidales bacterium]|nr:hypothetical protein [Bacteroidales bacterium]